MKYVLEIPETLHPAQPFIEQILEVAADYYKENDSAHDFDHALRVTRLALHLGEREGGDLEVLILAGILHDTARHEQELTGVCHAKRGAEIAEQILSHYNYNSRKSALVAEIIRTHRFRDNLTPQTIEAKILFDADKLDAIGAIGIGRAYAICGTHRQRLYTEEGVGFPPEDSLEYSPAVEFRFKLKKIVNRMLTNAGRELAIQRHNFMEQFFNQLEREVNGQI